MDTAIATAEREAAEAAKAAAKAHDQLLEWTEGEKLVIRSLKRIGEVIASAEFRQVSTAFVDEHKAQFEFQDENRLEWTAIHEQYVELMESTIVRLAVGVDMDALLEALPDFMSGGAQDRDPENTGATIDFLTSLVDFRTFKTMMLSARLDDGGVGEVVDLGEAAAGTIGAVDRSLNIDPKVMERARALLPLAQGDSKGWRTIASRQGEWELQSLTLNGKRYMRNSCNLVLSVDDCVEAFFNIAHPRAHKWDPSWEKLEPHTVTTNGKVTDIIVRAYPRMPGVIKFIASVPKSFIMRTAVQRDTPEPGKATCVSTTWDLERDAPLMTRMAMVRVALVEPAGPGMCRMYNVSQMPDAMPEWAMKVFMTNTIMSSVKAAARTFSEDKANGLV